jgi:hypothetical protein
MLVFAILKCRSACFRLVSGKLNRANYLRQDFAGGKIYWWQDLRQAVAEDDSAHWGSARWDDRAVTLRSVIEVGGREARRTRGPGAGDVSDQAHPREEEGVESREKKRA